MHLSPTNKKTLPNCYKVTHVTNHLRKETVDHLQIPFVHITDLILQRKLPNHIIGEFLFADALHDETAPGLRLSFLRPVAATLFLYVFVYYILAYTSFDIT